jgi:hypothetical protein
MTSCPEHGIQVNNVCCNLSKVMPEPGIPRTDRRKSLRDNLDLAEVSEEARRHIDDNNVGYWARLVLALVDQLKERQVPHGAQVQEQGSDLVDLKGPARQP